MTIYNHLQKLLGVDIEYYQNIIGKFIIYEKSGIVKEYELDTNILIFEGEYSKGKRNGFGKQFYDNDNLRFEGKYINGKRN